MSDYRNQGGFGRDRFRDDDSRDDRFGRTDERTARRERGNVSDEDRFRSESYASGREGDSRYGYGGRDDERRESGYGRGDYGYGSGSGFNRGESGYGRGSSGDYLSNTSRGYGRSSYGGVDFDRSDRSRGFGPDAGSRDTGSSSFGSNRDYGRGDTGSGRSGSDYGTGADRYRDAFGYGSDYRDRDRDTRGGFGYGSDTNRPGERSFFERAGDEISSWFGDHDAERRREADRQYGGRGPKNYTRSDDRIRDDVNDRLTDDHYLDASDIEVTVKDREVTLTGHVPSRDQKRRAEDVAERVSGVTHVQNSLRVQNQSQSQGQWTAGSSATGSTGYNQSTGSQSTGGTTASTGSYGTAATNTSATGSTADTTGFTGGTTGRTSSTS